MTEMSIGKKLKRRVRKKSLRRVSRKWARWPPESESPASAHVPELVFRREGPLKVGYYNSNMQNGFAKELARWGPQAHYGVLSRPQAQAYCARLARTHYENFSVASLLLPRGLI